jgi:hypothetical protein
MCSIAGSPQHSRTGARGSLDKSPTGASACVSTLENQRREKGFSPLGIPIREGCRDEWGPGERNSGGDGRVRRSKLHSRFSDYFYPVGKGVLCRVAAVDV